MKINALRYSFVFLGFTLVVALPSFAKDHQAFSMKVFTSPDDQFWTNSTIIEGAHEVMLVDAQLTNTSAEKVLQQIKDTVEPPWTQLPPWILRANIYLCLKTNSKKPKIPRVWSRL